MTRGEQIYNYPLYSIKRFPAFIKYCIPVAKQIGGGKWLSVLMDMIWCNLRYGAMDSRDYLLFEFDKKSALERNSFFTKRRYFKLIKHFNKEVFLRLVDKNEMYIEYSNFIKRRWMLINQETSEKDVLNFVCQYDNLLIKPMSAEQGQGVSIINCKDKDSLKNAIALKDKKPFILEELLHNCKEMNIINPSSLNTLRVFVIVPYGKDPVVISVSLRCGCGKSVVDNWGAGGICYPVDIESGIIYTYGRDKKGNTYIFHPGSHVQMVGMRIPFYKDAINCAIQCTKHNKDVIYTGVDLALTPTGPELVELNFPGGHDILQAIDQKGKNKLMQSII